ncbi:MAG: MarR family transcriptional regulator [Clostridia bacterium]|nr:MarR family transcriptional regulator [Clostridia bacterium]
MKNYDALKLEGQLCFPLYVASREIIKKYRPFLEKIDLTYTQYITMMVLWENEAINVKELGKRLYLDSGTLTPVLKSLEAKGLIKRERSLADERVLLVKVTKKGAELKDIAIDIPYEMSKCLTMSMEECAQLYSLLIKFINTNDQKEAH